MIFMTKIRGPNLEFEPFYRSFIHRKLNSMKKYYLVGFVLLFIACGKKEETILPTEGPITESIYASGILKSQDQYQAFVTVNGIIENILVKEGDVVRVGQPILQLSSETQKMSTENAQIAANFADKAANQGKLNEAQNVIETSFQNSNWIRPSMRDRKIFGLSKSARGSIWNKKKWLFKIRKRIIYHPSSASAT